MKMNFNTMNGLINALNELQETKIPFKLGLIIAKDLSALNKEQEFYVEQERNFATKYLETDENGQFVQDQPGAFKIKEGLEQECRDARKALDEFEIDIDLKKIPVELIESLDFTPKQLIALEAIIEEGE